MRSATVRVALSILVVAGLAGCRAGSLGPAPVVPASVSIGVMPFATGGDLDDGGRFRPSEETPAFPDTLPDHAASRLASELAQLGVSVLGLEHVRRNAPPAGAAIYGLDLATRVGRAVQADYMVIGAVSRYVERVGTSVGVESPASVAWRIVLVDVRRGTSAGTYRLDYTQSPLSDDLKQLPLWLQGKFGWMTRQEILDGSLRHAARQIARTVANTTPR